MNNLVDLYRLYYTARQITEQPSSWAVFVADWCIKLAATSLLDFGCGTNKGFECLRRKSRSIQSYDPAIAGLDAKPQAADIVTCIHVMEHLDDPDVDEAIRLIESLANKAVIMVISLEQSTKLLSDGSPWHRNVRSYHSWADRLSKYQPIPTLKGTLREWAGIYLKEAQL